MILHYGIWSLIYNKPYKGIRIFHKGYNDTTFFDHFLGHITDL